MHDFSRGSRYVQRDDAPLCKLHPQLAAMDMAHVVRVEGPVKATSGDQQLTLRD